MRTLQSNFIPCKQKNARIEIPFNPIDEISIITQRVVAPWEAFKDTNF